MLFCSMEKLTDIDAIILFLQDDAGKIKLTKPQEKKLERWDFCDSLIRLYKSRQKVINMMVNKFEIGKATALRDYYATQQVYGSNFSHNREYHVDLLLEEIAETRAVAKATQNATAMARCDANKASAIEKFMGDKDTPDYDKIQPRDVLLTFDPTLLGVKLLPEAELKKEISMLKRVDKDVKKMPQLNFDSTEEFADFMNLEDEG